MYPTTITTPDLGELTLSVLSKNIVTKFMAKDVMTLVSSDIITVKKAQKYTIGVFLDSDDTETIGEVDFFIFADSDPIVGYIHWVSVEKAYQNQKVATQVLTQIMSYLSANNIEIVYTHPVSAGAMSLFESADFTEDTQLNSGLNPWYSREV